MMKSLNRGSVLLTALLLLPPSIAGAAEKKEAPSTPATSLPQAQSEKVSYLSFGMRLGDETVEGYSDLIFPLFSTTKNTFFINPRISLKDAGENEGNIGLGYRHKLTDWLVGGANIYLDTRESEHDNRFNQWGAGLEFLSDYIDFRTNYYDADNSKELIGSYSETTTATATRTSSTYSAPFATGHEIVANKSTVQQTTTTVTNKFFEQFEAGMDGWDAEVGYKLPFSKGPEVRLFAGYYSYDNPLGDDFSGAKGRVEVKTGSWLTLDAELFEDEELNDTSYFLGFRLQVPLTSDLSWEKLRKGLVSNHHRNLDERMRGEMVVRDVRVQADVSDWQENQAKRQITRSVTEKKSTDRVVLADHITFVDGDNQQNGQNGTNENPYGTIQSGVDNAGANKTIFVYEKGGTIGRPGAADGGSFYDEQVTLKKGQTLTSAISWSGPNPGVYATANRPVIRPTAIKKTISSYGFTIVPVVAMAPQTTVRRMALDATAPAIAEYGDWLKDEYSAALFADINETKNTGLRVEDNHITTSGAFSYGMRLHAIDGENSRIDIASNNIESDGFTGISINAYRAINADINLSGMDITTSGRGNGVYIDLQRSENAEAALSAMRVTTTGDFTNGVNVYALGAKNPRISSSKMEINTAGILTHGVEFTISDSENAVINSSETKINTSGGSSGMDIVAINSKNAAITSSEMEINSANGFAGISMLALNSTDTAISLSKIKVNTAGEGSYGVSIATEGANGMNINASEMAITTEGAGSAGLYFYAKTTNPITSSIKDNDFTINGANSWGILAVEDLSNSFTASTLEMDNNFTINGPGSVKVDVIH